MIITKEIVFLNYPKTGSTFVRKTIKEIYNRRINKSFVKRVLRKLKFPLLGYAELKLEQPEIPGYFDQHGRYYMIPEKHLNKKIVSVVRNPYDRFMSIYQFKNWQEHPGISNEQIQEHFPNFPDLSIDEFVELKKINSSNYLAKHGVNNLEIGFQTLQFIDFFLKTALKY